MMTNKYVALALASTALAAACSKVEGREEPALRPVKVMETRIAAPASGVRYAVTIQPESEVSLAFKVAGYVSTIPQRRGADGRMRPLQAGDPIRNGETLATVQDSEYQERVNQLDGSLREMAATRAKAGRDLARAKALFETESLTRPDFDAALAAYDTASARMASVGAQVELAQISLRDTALVSPITGVVFERRVEIGSLVNGGSVGFLVGDVSSVKARFGVPDGLVHRIALGTPLRVTTEALSPDTFQGTVTAIAPSADPQGHVFSIEVTVPNSDGRLKPGMIGAVEVRPEPDDADAAPSFPAVPLTAIVRSTAGGDEYAVFVVERNGDRDVARSRPVTLGTVRGNMMMVMSGLAAGDRVVVMGANLVHDQEHVHVIP